jgi:hypothetical protein
MKTAIVTGASKPLSFETTLFKINSWTILLLPKEASRELPSRGMTMVEGTINGVPFKTVLEPDGRGSHWFRVENDLQKSAKAIAGDTVNVELATTKEWIKPEVPADFKKAIVSDKKIHELWNDITPIAQWDWIRWVRAVKTVETRQKHIEVAMSKLGKGMRRPCCFNRNLCSEPAVAHNWVLIDPTQ